MCSWGFPFRIDKWHLHNFAASTSGVCGRIAIVPDGQKTGEPDFDGYGLGFVGSLKVFEFLFLLQSIVDAGDKIVEGKLLFQEAFGA